MTLLRTAPLAARTKFPGGVDGGAADMAATPAGKVAAANPIDPAHNDLDTELAARVAVAGTLPAASDRTAGEAILQGDALWEVTEHATAQAAARFGRGAMPAGTGGGTYYGTSSSYGSDDGWWLLQGAWDHNPGVLALGMVVQGDDVVFGVVLDQASYVARKRAVAGDGALSYAAGDELTWEWSFTVNDTVYRGAVALTFYEQFEEPIGTGQLRFQSARLDRTTGVGKQLYDQLLRASPSRARTTSSVEVASSFYYGDILGSEAGSASNVSIENGNVLDPDGSTNTAHNNVVPLPANGADPDTLWSRQADGRSIKALEWCQVTVTLTQSTPDAGTERTLAYRATVIKKDDSADVTVVTGDWVLPASNAARSESLVAELEAGDVLYVQRIANSGGALIATGAIATVAVEAAGSRQVASAATLAARAVFASVKEWSGVHLAQVRQLAESQAEETAHLQSQIDALSRVPETPDIDRDALQATDRLPRADTATHAYAELIDDGDNLDTALSLELANLSTRSASPTDEYDFENGSVTLGRSGVRGGHAILATVTGRDALNLHDFSVSREGIVTCHKDGVRFEVRLTALTIGTADIDFGVSFRRTDTGALIGAAHDVDVSDVFGSGSTTLAKTIVATMTVDLDAGDAFFISLSSANTYGSGIHGSIRAYNSETETVDIAVPLRAGTYRRAPLTIGTGGNARNGCAAMTIGRETVSGTTYTGYAVKVAEGNRTPPADLGETLINPYGSILSFYDDGTDLFLYLEERFWWYVLQRENWRRWLQHGKKADDHSASSSGDSPPGTDDFIIDPLRYVAGGRYCAGDGAGTATTCGAGFDFITPGYTHAQAQAVDPASLYGSELRSSVRLWAYDSDGASLRTTLFPGSTENAGSPLTHTGRKVNVGYQNFIEFKQFNTQIPDSLVGTQLHLRGVNHRGRQVPIWDLRYPRLDRNGDLEFTDADTHTWTPEGIAHPLAPAITNAIALATADLVESSAVSKIAHVTDTGDFARITKRDGVLYLVGGSGGGIYLGSLRIGALQE